MDAKQILKEGRRLIIQIGIELLNDLEQIPALALLDGGRWRARIDAVNLKIVVNLVDWLKVADALPGDATATWCWTDVGRQCLSILVWSEEFERVDPGSIAPERWIRIAHTELDGVDEFVPSLYDPHAPVVEA